MSSMNKNGNVEGGNEKSPIYDFFKSNIIILYDDFRDEQWKAFR